MRALLLLLLVACKSGGEVRNKTPYEEIPFARGPSIAPSAELLSWLAEQKTPEGDPKLVRLPFQLSNDGAKVGEVAVRVSDTAMGISLADHVHTHCREREVCRAWLEGRWRTTDAEHRFHAVRFVRVIAEGEDASWAEVETTARREETERSGVPTSGQKAH